MKPTCGPLPWAMTTSQPCFDHVGDVLTSIPRRPVLVGNGLVRFIHDQRIAADGYNCNTFFVH